MASLETVSATGEISPRFDKLLKDVTTELSTDELKHVVLSIKSNFKGKYEDQEEQDLYSCLHLFANQGLVSEDNLTLLERFVTPKTSKKGRIEEKIHAFKKISLREVKTKDEFDWQRPRLGESYDKANNRQFECCQLVRNQWGRQDKAGHRNIFDVARDKI
ncbi:hypothetical protein OS493_038277 [Desmophyllum pertusum]|uniref:Uncharacterized protein n=1 Tax=Desmophyllum pertusum TaxID=174260 RepID=A0A9W9ZUY4_9CNID|nr:hypothetical protein OS493_038277 [Desmophyllum pertusum]